MRRTQRHMSTLMCRQNGQPNKFCLGNYFVQNVDLFKIKSSAIFFCKSKQKEIFLKSELCRTLVAICKVLKKFHQKNICDNSSKSHE